MRRFVYIIENYIGIVRLSVVPELIGVDNSILAA